MKMEIPTKDIIQRIQASIDFGTSLTVGGRNEAIATINAQALEIRELQAVIVRMRGVSDALNRVFLEADSNNSTLNCWIHENNKMEGV
jgi:hypothetical protein